MGDYFIPFQICKFSGHSTHFQVGGDNQKVEGGV